MAQRDFLLAYLDDPGKKPGFVIQKLIWKQLMRNAFAGQVIQGTGVGMFCLNILYLIPEAVAELNITFVKVRDVTQ